MRETPYTQLSPLAQALMQAIQPHLNKPFAFFGHSMGATIGFELARELRRRHAAGPVHLFVSGGRAPQLPDPNPPIHHLPEKEFLAGLRRFNGTPEEVLRNPELMELFLPLLRADLAVLETYTYTDGEPLDCPISAFGGLEDEEVSQDGIAAWRDQTRGAFTLCMLPGNHFFLRTARTLLLHAVSQNLKLLLSQITGG